MKELIERHKREAVWHGRRLVEEMRPDPNGRWCKYRDVKDALEQMQAERDAFEGSFNAAIKHIDELEADRRKWVSLANKEHERQAELKADNERLRGLLQEGVEVADDLITKTDLYLGINEAHERHEKWIAAVQESEPSGTGPLVLGGTADG